MLILCGLALTDRWRGRRENLEPSRVQGQGCVKGRVGGIESLVRKKTKNKKSCPGLVDTCRLQKPVRVMSLRRPAGEILSDMMGREDQERDSH